MNTYIYIKLKRELEKFNSESFFFSIGTHKSGLIYPHWVNSSRQEGGADSMIAGRCCCRALPVPPYCHVQIPPTPPQLLSGYWSTTYIFLMVIVGARLIREYEILFSRVRTKGITPFSRCDGNSWRAFRQLQPTVWKPNVTSWIWTPVSFLDCFDKFGEIFSSPLLFFFLAIIVEKRFHAEYE